MTGCGERSYVALTSERWRCAEPFSLVGRKRHVSELPCILKLMSATLPIYSEAGQAPGTELFRPESLGLSAELKHPLRQLTCIA